MIFKICYCKWCGNENLRETNFDRIYCHNCGEYSDKSKIGCRDIEETEEVKYVYKSK